MCVCVRERAKHPAAIVNFCIPIHKSGRNAVQACTCTAYTHFHQPTVFKQSHTYIQTLMLCLIHSCLTCMQQNHTQMTAHTSLFFPHSCVQISNRASWERTNTLTRKEGVTHAHTLDACAGSSNKLTVLQEITKAAWPALIVDLIIKTMVPEWNTD